MTFGAVAQLGERRPCKAEVAGSIPVSSTKILARRRQRSTFPQWEARAVASRYQRAKCPGSLTSKDSDIAPSGAI